MLLIRQAQLNAMMDAQRADFVQEMCRHLLAHFRPQLAVLDATDLRKCVSRTLDRAMKYGFTTRQEYCRYLNLAALYGWQFDEDPQYRWMRDYLTDSGIGRPVDRLDRLIDACLERLEIEEFGLNLDGMNEEESESLLVTKPEPARSLSDRPDAREQAPGRGAPAMNLDDDEEWIARLKRNG